MGVEQVSPNGLPPCGTSFSPILNRAVLQHQHRSVSLAVLCNNGPVSEPSGLLALADSTVRICFSDGNTAKCLNVLFLKVIS